MRSPGLYPIGIVADFLHLNRRTLRVWDLQGLVKPQRRRGMRCYSDDDLRRLVFIRHLLDDRGLNLASIRAYLELYPCWSSDACRPCHGSLAGNGKPCWKEPNTYCGLLDEESQRCEDCKGQADTVGGPPLPLRDSLWDYPTASSWHKGRGRNGRWLSYSDRYSRGD